MFALSLLHVDRGVKRMLEVDVLSCEGVFRCRSNLLSLLNTCVQLVNVLPGPIFLLKQNRRLVVARTNERRLTNEAPRKDGRARVREFLPRWLLLGLHIIAGHRKEVHH